MSLWSCFTFVNSQLCVFRWILDLQGKWWFGWLLREWNSPGQFVCISYGTVVTELKGGISSAMTTTCLPTFPHHICPGSCRDRDLLVSGGSWEIINQRVVQQHNSDSSWCTGGTEVIQRSGVPWCWQEICICKKKCHKIGWEGVGGLVVVCCVCRWYKAKLFWVWCETGIESSAKGRDGVENMVGVQ